MTDVEANVAEHELRLLHEAVHALNPTLDFHLFLTLSF